MKAKTGLVVAVLFFLIPWATHAKERGTVVDIWEQMDSYGNHFYIYQVETETNLYDFLGDGAQVFHAGDTITFAINMHHRQVRVSAGERKVTLFLVSRGPKSAA